MDFWRWNHFSPSEVLSTDGLKEYKKGNLLVQEFALDMLDVFREQLGVPIICNIGDLKLRGYRSFNENNRLPSPRIYSRHMQGIAFDLTAPALNVLDFYKEAIAFGFGGIGFYPNSNFIHVDCRPIVTTQALWEG